MSLDQIGLRCIDLNFSEAKVKEWVTQLTSTTDFDWEDAVTAGEKRANRAKKIYESKNKKQILEEKKRKHEEWVQRNEEKKMRQEAYMAKKAEIDAKKEEKRNAHKE